VFLATYQVAFSFKKSDIYRCFTGFSFSVREEVQSHSLSLCSLFLHWMEVYMPSVNRQEISNGH